MKKLKNNAAIYLLAVAALGVGCSSGAYRSQAETQAQRNAAAEAEVRRPDYGASVVVNFDQGSADLTERSKTQLRDIVSSLGAREIQRVEIASWSDREFPKAGGDLPKSDRDLADHRADNIENFLKKEMDLSALRIRDYNMAETSNWMARTFRTDEAELKSIFAKQGEAPVAREDFNTIMKSGGGSKAVVVLIRK